MIDLAGSERTSVTGRKGERFKEGVHINRSLLALGNCINNLAAGIQHIPFGDSKLTRLLKDSLGGNCQTLMIANISPSSFCYEDTYNNLHYADRTKMIKTTVKKNIVACKLSLSDYAFMLSESRKEIITLKSKLEMNEHGSTELQKIVPNGATNAAMYKEFAANKQAEILEKLKDLMDAKTMLSKEVYLFCKVQTKLCVAEQISRIQHMSD